MDESDTPKPKRRGSLTLNGTAIALSRGLIAVMETVLAAGIAEEEEIMRGEIVMAAVEAAAAVAVVMTVNVTEATTVGMTTKVKK